jgi:hypothetical protein
MGLGIVADASRWAKTTVFVSAVTGRVRRGTRLMVAMVAAMNFATRLVGTVI